MATERFSSILLRPFDQATLSHEFAPEGAKEHIMRIIPELRKKRFNEKMTKKIKAIAEEAGENPGGANSRLLVATAAETLQYVSNEVFGPHQQPLNQELQMARDWSARKKIDLETLRNHWWEL